MKSKKRITPLWLSLCLLISFILYQMPVKAEPVTLNRYASFYDPYKFNYSGGTLYVGNVTDHIQFRMNCYGYAFRYLYENSVTLSFDGGYKQQPGQFVYGSNINLWENLEESTDELDLMDRVINNLYLDAEMLGFTMEECLVSTAPFPQYGGYGRVIAVVTGGSISNNSLDYHFYMQHDDGTWSHKPGSSAVTNIALKNSADEPDVILTNENIMDKANSGLYGTCGTNVRFFYITRDTVIDHLNTYGNAYGYGSSIVENDVAGDYLNLAIPFSVTSGMGKTEFPGDVDVHSFVPSYSGLFSINPSMQYNSNLVLFAIVDEYGDEVYSNSGYKQLYINQYLYSGRVYFFVISEGLDDSTYYQINVN